MISKRIGARGSALPAPIWQIIKMSRYRGNYFSPAAPGRHHELSIPGRNIIKPILPVIRPGESNSHGYDISGTAEPGNPGDCSP